MKAYYIYSTLEGFFYALKVKKVPTETIIGITKLEKGVTETISVTPFLTFVTAEMEKAATEMVSVTPFLTFVAAEMGKAATEMVSVTPFLAFSGNKNGPFAVNTLLFTFPYTSLYTLLTQQIATK